MPRDRRVDSKSFRECRDLSVFSWKRLALSKGRSTVVFWTILGKLEDCSHESLCIMRLVASEWMAVSAASTAAWRVIFTTNLPSSMKA